MAQTNGHSIVPPIPADVVIVDAPAPKPKGRKARLSLYEVWAMNKKTGKAERLCDFKAENDEKALEYFKDVIPESLNATFCRARSK